MVGRNMQCKNDMISAVCPATSALEYLRNMKLYIMKTELKKKKRMRL